MKRFLFLTALLVASPTLRADTPEFTLASAPAATPQQEVRAKLPAYSPEEHARALAEQEAQAKAAAKARAAAEADADLVVLPPMTVMEKAQRQMAEDSLYRKGAHDKELVKRELSEFDRYVLNRFTIPFIGVSKEARAREAYLAHKNIELQDKLARLNRMVAALDKDEARDFRATLRDASLDNRNTAKEAARATSAKGGSGGLNSQ